MTEPVLKMRRVGKTHGKGAQRVDALVDIDLDVARGEFVAITGRSGSGKTTCSTSQVRSTSQPPATSWLMVRTSAT